MGLKTFHLAFVTCATLLALGLCGYALLGWARYGQAVWLAAAVGAAAAAGALVVYGAWFWRKLKGLPS